MSLLYDIVLHDPPAPVRWLARRLLTDSEF